MVLDREAERAIEHFKQSLGHSMAIPPNSLNNLHKILDNHRYRYQKDPECIQVSHHDYRSLMQDASQQQTIVFMSCNNNNGVFVFQGVSVIPTHTLGIGEVVINPNPAYVAPRSPQWDRTYIYGNN